MDFDNLNFRNDSNKNHWAKNILGKEEDLLFFKEDQWLQDTAVIFNVKYESGKWNVYLVFASIHNCFKFIRKKINSFYSEARAKLFAELYQRGARKDPRGTLKVNIHDFNICYN